MCVCVYVYMRVCGYISKSSFNLVLLFIKLLIKKESDPFFHDQLEFVPFKKIKWPREDGLAGWENYQTCPFYI